MTLEKLTGTKADFFKKFRRMAEEVAEIIKPLDLEAYVQYWLEDAWKRHVEWYKTKYNKAYRDSLTLEQLWRLDN